MSSGSPLLALVGFGPGLSLEIARRFGREGCRLALLSNQSEARERLIQRLEEEGLEAQGFEADAGKTEDLWKRLQILRSSLGPVDILVYNPSASLEMSLEDLRESNLQATLQVNLMGALAAAQGVLPGMQERGRGTMLFTGGGSALTPRIHQGALCIGKAALRMLALNLALEWEPFNIHVATFTIAGFIQKGGPLDPEELAEDYWRVYQQKRDVWEREILWTPEGRKP